MKCELEIQHEIWQKILNAQLLWLAEIGDAFGVDVAHSFYDNTLFIQDSIVYEEVAPLMPEIEDMRHATEILQPNIMLIHGDPCPGGFDYHPCADLSDRTPKQALIEAGLACIDTVLIGPEQRASQLLASDERLYFSAKTRSLYMSELAHWQCRVRQIIAAADSLRAQSAIANMLPNGKQSNQQPNECSQSKVSAAGDRVNANSSVMNKIEDVVSALTSQDPTSLHMHMHELCTRLGGDPIGDDALALSRACFISNSITESDVAAIEIKLKKITEALNGSGS
jgi:hypothetical protein